MGVYGEAYVKLLSETTEFIKRADANARTVRQFGRRWFRNFFRNLGMLSLVVRPVSLSVPLAVTGAGPSLEDVIPLLREEQRKSSLLVLAVSSSVAALRAGGVEPDIVIASDGGGWALLHLYECLRGGPENKVFAAALTAALPSQCGRFPVLALSDGSLWQELVLKELSIPFVSLPQRGTVSAAALDLAFILTGGNIYLSGVDLSHKDIRTHTRPYSFDRLWEEKSSRFDPFYSQIYDRSARISAGGSHDIYASWFSRQLEAYPRRLFSLGSNSPVFGSLRAASFGEGRGEKDPPGGKPFFSALNLRFQENPAVRGPLILKAALTNPRYTARLIAELCPLLFPGEAPVSPEELGEAVIWPRREAGCG
jgi:hypothetical protein